MRICNPVSVLVQAVTLRDNNHQGSGLKKYSKKNPPHPTLMNPTFQNSGDERHPHHLNSSKHRWRGPLGLKRGCWEDFGMDPTGIDLISAHGPKKKKKGELHFCFTSAANPLKTAIICPQNIQHANRKGYTNRPIISIWFVLTSWAAAVIQ